MPFELADREGVQGAGPGREVAEPERAVLGCSRQDAGRRGGELGEDQVAFQWPGTVRSSASAGRWLLITMSRSWPVSSPPATRAALGSPGAQAAGQLAAQLAAALHVQGLGDRLVAHHIMGSPANSIRTGPRSAPATTIRHVTTGPGLACSRNLNVLLMREMVLP